MKQRPVLQKNLTVKAPLYRHIFYGRFSFVVVLLLLSSIILQPIDRASASEGEEPVAPAPIDTSTVAATDLPVVTTEPATPEVPADEATTAEATDSVTTDATTAPVVVPSPEPISPLVAGTSTTDVATTTTTTSTTATSDPLPATATPESAAETPIDAVASSTNTDTPEAVTLSVLPTLPVVDDLLPLQPDLTATTTIETVSEATTTGEVLLATATIASDSQIQFEKSDCVAVADGSYYCKINNPNPVSDVKDGLYSKPDADGDLEIYFAHDGTLEQITHNDVDDGSPYFDSISNTIVWHRLINDRYQIISYDIQSGAESQLTTDTVNNMEPTRAGKYTAWQHWNVDNWDIMLYDGATTKLLTTVPEHDIAPKVRSNLVMWNRLSRDNTQTIELYDVITGEYTSIADDEGGELSNPRMVLVYDAQFKNGDIITKGYDVITGKITPLSATPVKIPDSIPEPDDTGETRALIQMKTSSREDAEVASTTPIIDPPEPDTGTSTATSSLTLNLQLPIAASTTLATSTDSLKLDLSASTTLQLTVSDVVVPLFVASSTETEPVE